MVASSMDQTPSSLTSRGSTQHPMPLGLCPPPTTLARGCQDSSYRANTHHPLVPWASTTRCRNSAIQQLITIVMTWPCIKHGRDNVEKAFLFCFIKLQQEPPFNGQTNNFTGSGYQYNQGNMNGVNPFLCRFFMLHVSTTCNLKNIWFTNQFSSI